MLYVQIATIGGALLGGALADLWIAAHAARPDLRERHRHDALPARRCSAWATRARSALAILFLILFGVGWGFFDCNNMPILCQITRPELRATGYGIMNLVSISCGGFGDWGFGVLRSQGVPLTLIFGCFTGVALLSLLVVLLIRPGETKAP